MIPLPPDPLKRINERVAALKAKSEQLKEEARLLQERLRHLPQPTPGGAHEPQFQP
jgi:hypothetical protein